MVIRQNVTPEYSGQAKVLLDHLKQTGQSPAEAVSTLGLALTMILVPLFRACSDDLELLNYLDNFKSSVLDAYTKTEAKHA